MLKSQAWMALPEKTEEYNWLQSVTREKWSFKEWERTNSGGRLRKWCREMAEGGAFYQPWEEECLKREKGMSVQCGWRVNTLQELGSVPGLTCEHWHQLSTELRLRGNQTGGDKSRPGLGTILVGMRADKKSGDDSCQPEGATQPLEEDTFGEECVFILFTGQGGK